MELEEIDNAYQSVLYALDEFESACGEHAEEDTFATSDGYDERTSPEEFFLPEEDFNEIKRLLKKIKTDVAKSQTINIGRYKRENGKFFHKV